LVVGGAIMWIKTTLNYFMKASRFWLFDVDNVHQKFNYSITAFPGAASLLRALKRGWHLLAVHPGWCSGFLPILWICSNQW
jgi:hypothetical protein